MEFASDYVAGKFRGSCTDFTLLDRRERPDAVAELNQLLSQFGSRGLSVRVEAGEVRFTCNSGGRPLEGYFLAATQRVSNELFAMWSVPHLYGYLAPPAEARQAQAVLERMLASFELDQDWSDKQDEQNRQTSHELKLENTVIMGILRRSWASRDPAPGHHWHSVSRTHGSWRNRPRTPAATTRAPLVRTSIGAPRLSNQHSAAIFAPHRDRHEPDKRSLLRRWHARVNRWTGCDAH